MFRGGEISLDPFDYIEKSYSIDWSLGTVPSIYLLLWSHYSFTMGEVDNAADNTSKEVSFARTAKLLNCGLVSGLIQAAVFNPWDRALYLSVMHNRSFLHAENFKNPMAGVMQTITQRAISAGLYFPLEEIFAETMTKYANGNGYPGQQRYIHFVAGLLAGSTNGMLLNPFSSVKVKFSCVRRRHRI